MTLSEVYIKSQSQYGHSLRSRSEHLKWLLYSSDELVLSNLGWIDTFIKLCSMLKTVGQLRDTRKMNVDEQVAMSLHILAHHMKNRAVKFRFMRSGETVSRHFHAVLNAVLRLHEILLKHPEPIQENSTDEK